jgi:hypothetical protein
MSLLNGALKFIIGSLYKYAAPMALGQVNHCHFLTSLGAGRGKNCFL